MNHRPKYLLARLLAALTAVVLAAAGCARCSGGASGKSAEEFISADSSLVVSAPDLGRLADNAQALLGTLRAGAGGAQAVAFTANLARQLGFDPLTREGQKEAGLDPARSLAMGAANEVQAAYAALPYSDKAVLEATLVRLARDRSGAGVREQRKADDVSITVLTHAAGAAPLIAWADKDRFLIVGVGDGAESVVAAAVQRKPDASVARSGAFAASKKNVGLRDLYVMMPKGSRGALGTLPDTTLGLGVGKNEIAMRAFVAQSAEDAQTFRSLLVGGGEKLLRRLPADRPAYLRGGIDWTALKNRMETNGILASDLVRAREAAKEAGIDLDQDLFDNLEPAFAVSVGLAAAPKLASALDFNPRRRNPFESYSLLALAQVKDAARGARTLDKLASVVETLGTTVSRREAGGATIYTAHYARGESLSWTLRGHQLVLAGGLGEQLDQALSAVQNDGTESPSGTAGWAKEVLWSDKGVAFAFDFQRLAQMVEKLPNESFGTGPGALMMRSVAQGFVQPMARVKSVMAVTPADGGFTVDVALDVK